MNNYTTKRRKPTRWNTETFKERVYELVEDEYTFHGEYTRTKDHMEVTHNKCGRDYVVTAGSFLGGVRCRDCMYAKKSKDYVKTHKQFIKDLHKVHGNDYVPMQEYTGVHNKIDFKHAVCGETWNATPSMLLSGSTCIHCHGKVHDEESFKSKLDMVTNGEFLSLGKYTGSGNKMNFLHKECGTILNVTPNNILGYKSCPECHQSRPITNEETYLSQLFEAVGNDYTLIDKYRVKTDAYTFKHNRCGRTFKAMGSDLLRGRGCTKCKMSSGEEDVFRYLEANIIEHVSEYRIDECKYIIPLPFDFATFKDGKLTSLIEFEGGQHYRSIEMFGGDEGLANRQRNDQIKRDYCKDNNIKLIEIPYWEQDNIPKILNEALI